MSDINWLISRLRAMPLKEVLHRMVEHSTYKHLEKKYNEDLNILHIIDDSIVDIVKLDKQITPLFNLPKIDMDNNMVIKDFFKYDLTEDINYHKGQFGVWDKNKFCKKIDYKDSDNIGDIRVTWEINRHQFLPYIALCYSETNDKKYIDMLEKHFYSWIEQNKYLKGVNWNSSMEIAIRSYQWLITFYILKDLGENKFRIDLIKAIIVSMKHVRRNFSKYSSANNHLIIEAYITSIIGYCLKPIYKQDWFNYGYNELKNHLKLQFFDDGVNKEQAIHYQAFVTDAMLQYNIFLKKINKEPLYEKVIKKSLEFICDVEASEGYSDFGDSDDAQILKFSLQKINYYDYVLNLGTVYYNKKFTSFNKYYPEVYMFTEKHKLITEKHITNNCSIYKDGGYCIVKDSKTFLLFDVGQLGFGSLATHGHADALSIIYKYNDIPFIVDSGTYIYTIQREKRNYYRGTLAHNTLIYNNLNQSEIKGPGLWGKKAISKLINHSENDNYLEFEAEHNGYLPHIHKRKITYEKESAQVEIVDYFTEVAQLNFIISEAADIYPVNINKVKIVCCEKTIFIETTGIIRVEDTVISRSFTEEMFTRKLVINNDFKQNYKIVTKIRPI